MNEDKKRIFIDMDGVLADFDRAVRELPDEMNEKYKGKQDEIPGIFRTLKPIPSSITSVFTLSKYFDLFILSTPSWGNSGSPTEKIEWIKDIYGDKIGSPFYKKIVLTHRKDLLIGDYLIDDRPVNGAKEFTGEFIHFGSEGFETWNEVLLYIINKEGILHN